jgi:SOS-response transcriptional repressor LexA
VRHDSGASVRSADELNQYDLNADDFEMMPQLKGRGLTERQSAVLEFIRQTIDATGRPPGTRKIAKHFGFKWQQYAVDVVRALEHKGYITSKPGVQWSVRLTAKAMEERPPR